MSKFDQTTSNFYSQHKKASETLDKASRYLSAVEADARYRGHIALRDNNPVLHQEARSLFQETDTLARRKKTAQRKYDDNLADAAAHKDQHLDKYIAVAHDEMLEHEVGKAAVVNAAEDILRQADLGAHTNPTHQQTHFPNEHPES